MPFFGDLRESDPRTAPPAMRSLMTFKDPSSLDVGSRGDLRGVGARFTGLARGRGQVQTSGVLCLQCKRAETVSRALGNAGPTGCKHGREHWGMFSSPAGKATAVTFSN